MTRYIYVGTSTASGVAHRIDGIFVYRMGADTGRIELVQAVASGPNPSFLALHPNRRFLYAVNETNNGQVSAFTVDSGTGRLRYLNRTAIGSDGPCFVTVEPGGKWLLTANYSGGSLSVLSLGAEGRVGPVNQVVRHQGSSADPAKPFVSTDNRAILGAVRPAQATEGVNAERQEKAHVHCVVFDPAQRFVLSADLGQDRIWVYRFDPAAGWLLPALSASSKATPVGNDAEGPAYGWQQEGEAEQYTLAGIQLNPGAGPRHLAFHPNGKYLYVSNELDSTVSAFAWEGVTAALQPLETHSTLPADYREENYPADIHLTPDGRWLFVSNRGHDSLACFAVDEATGRLTAAGHFSTRGHWPRNFAITADGQFLLAANERSSSLSVYRIDESTGSLAPEGGLVSVPNPQFVMPVDMP